MDQIDNYLGTVIPVIKLSTHPTMIPWHLTIHIIHTYYIYTYIRIFFHSTITSGFLLPFLHKILLNDVQYMYMYMQYPT